MKKLISFLKSIWSYFFGKKETFFDEPQSEIQKKYEIPKGEAGRIIKIRPMHTMLFRKQQLPGKIIVTGNEFFRIGKMLSSSHLKKFKYEIEII